jgi:excinuclease ABC subunit C
MNLKEKIQNLPSQPGVYLLKDSKSNIIYIGKAKSLKNRVSSYFQKSSPYDAKSQALISKISDFDSIVTDSEMEALILESNLVKEHHPRYNIDLKDDKRFPYIKVSTYEKFPRILVVRRIKKDNAKYFGPYTDVGAMRQTLKNMKTLFPLRTCNQSLPLKRASRPCLSFHLKRCLAPCQENIKEEEYSKLISDAILFLSGRNKALRDELKKRMDEYAEEQNYEMAAQIRDELVALESITQTQKVADSEEIDRDIIAFAREGGSVCIVTFQVREGILIGRQHFYLNVPKDASDEETITSFLKQYYLNSPFVPKQIFLPIKIEDEEIVSNWLNSKRGERVELVFPQRGEKVKLLEMACANARLLLKELLIQKAQKKEYIPASIKSLKEALYMAIFPKNIVAFDISNLGGTDAVGSLVYFQNGKPKKSEYRRFKIRTVEGQDDFAMMEEVVKRYFSNLMEENSRFPDLILIDGGKGQLHSALKALASIGIKDQLVVGLAKRLDEVFLPGRKDSLMIPKTSPALRLLQGIGDEAHRFAITYHKNVRGKKIVLSQIDEIKGIGKKRKIALLSHFGSVERIRNVSLEELTEVEGISSKIAEVVHNYFHQNEGEER